jgi:predicted nuclease of restriction endonuclease-like RecB superfamily
MFALPPDDLDLGDMHQLDEAIDELCEIVGGDREAVIRGLAEIVRRRTEFEALKQLLDSR